MVAIAIDNAAPTAAVILGLAPGSDTGADAADGVTPVLRPVVTGTAEAGARVEVLDGTASRGTTTAELRTSLPRSPGRGEGDRGAPQPSA